MISMVAGKGPNPVRTEEFVLIEHASQNPAQSVLIHQRSNTAVAIPKCPIPVAWMLLRSLGHTFQPFA